MRDDGAVATPSPRGKQVKIEVDVWYDASTKRVHLASSDPDLGPKGLHTSFKPGSTPEARFLTLLGAHDKLPEGISPPAD